GEGARAGAEGGDAGGEVTAAGRGAQGEGQGGHGCEGGQAARGYPASARLRLHAGTSAPHGSRPSPTAPSWSPCVAGCAGARWEGRSCGALTRGVAAPLARNVVWVTRISGGRGK